MNSVAPGFDNLAAKVFCGLLNRGISVDSVAGIVCHRLFARFSNSILLTARRVEKIPKPSLAIDSKLGTFMVFKSVSSWSSDIALRRSRLLYCKTQGIFSEARVVILEIFGHVHQGVVVVCASHKI